MTLEASRQALQDLQREKVSGIEGPWPRRMETTVVPEQIGNLYDIKADTMIITTT
jgi:hypothetical protein